MLLVLLLHHLLPLLLGLAGHSSVLLLPLEKEAALLRLGLALDMLLHLLKAGGLLSAARGRVRRMIIAYLVSGGPLTDF